MVISHVIIVFIVEVCNHGNKAKSNSKTCSRIIRIVTISVYDSFQINEIGKLNFRCSTITEDVLNYSICLLEYEMY